MGRNILDVPTVFPKANPYSNLNLGMRSMPEDNVPSQEISNRANHLQCSHRLSLP